MTTESRLARLERRADEAWRGEVARVRGMTPDELEAALPGDDAPCEFLPGVTMGRYRAMLRELTDAEILEAADAPTSDACDRAILRALRRHDLIPDGGRR